jgi:hypothetical protein
MGEAIWRAVAMLPGLPELGVYPTPLECAEAADHFAGLLGVAVRCFAAVSA